MKILVLTIMLVFPMMATAKKKVIYRKTQEVNFDETNVDGTARRPDGAYVHQKRAMKFMPLYKVKERFNDEIKESVEYLR